MERGLYAAATGMLAQQAIQDTLAQNIANANTVGYKQDNTTFRALQTMKLHRLENGASRGPEIGSLGAGVQADKTYTDWQTGSLTSTNNPLDASLGDNQFFAVSTPRGERYTRAGNFRLDGAGKLYTAAGQPVLDTTGKAIQIATKNEVGLDRLGRLMDKVTKLPVATLKVAQGDPNGMVKEGDSLFASTTPRPLNAVAVPTVRPGTLEQSNVNAVRSLVQMITVTRSFDMAQRAITTQDELLRHATTEVGKL